MDGKKLSHFHELSLALQSRGGTKKCLPAAVATKPWKNHSPRKYFVKHQMCVIHLAH